jgi:hypothetical protein
VRSEVKIVTWSYLEKFTLRSSQTPLSMEGVFGVWRCGCSVTSQWWGPQVMGHKDKTTQEQLAMVAQRDYTARDPLHTYRSASAVRGFHLLERYRLCVPTSPCNQARKAQRNPVTCIASSLSACVTATTQPTTGG